MQTEHVPTFFMSPFCVILFMLSLLNMVRYLFFSEAGRSTALQLLQIHWEGGG